MKEEFLHYLWRYQLFSNREQLQFDGEKIEVINPGEYNSDSGPDFFNAKIKIGNTLWAGNIEVHTRSSDWEKHKHQSNNNYDNIILHVVGKNDRAIKRKSGETIPCIEIQSPKNLYKQYLYLMQSNDWVPCETFINKVDDFILLQWKEALLIERLQEKSKIIQERFEQNKHNFEETFYQSLAANFGFKINALPFEQLAKSLALNVLAKQKDQLPLIEALLFGQSGLLDKATDDDYTMALKRDYKHLKAKYKLTTQNADLWKFMRMRPANFPTIRIAQFAQLIHQSTALFSRILETKSLQDIKPHFNIKPSVYWETHYTFNNNSTYKQKHLGEKAFENIAINTIVPTLFLYGKLKEKQKFIDLALSLLTEIKAEDNAIIKSWKALSVNVEQAFDSQALIQLKNVYCRHRRCLSCRIGNQVIKHTI